MLCAWSAQAAETLHLRRNNKASLITSAGLVVSVA